MKAFNKIINGEPKLFTLCAGCQKEVEFVTTYEAKFEKDWTKDPMDSGTISCKNCSRVLHIDGMIRRNLQGIFEAKENEMMDIGFFEGSVSWQRK
jgi:hypothetical protein